MVFKIRYMLCLSLVAVASCLASEADTCLSNYRIHIGPTLGLGAPEYGFSKLVLEYGVVVQYATSHRTLALMFNHYPSSELNIATDFYYPRDESNIDRLELSYGLNTCFKEDHKLFRYVYFGYSLGLTYNSLRYYKDEQAWSNGHITKVKQLGIPIGVSMTIREPMSSSFYVGYNVKYHIVKAQKGYCELSGILMMRIL